MKSNGGGNSDDGGPPNRRGDLECSRTSLNGLVDEDNSGGTSTAGAAIAVGFLEWVCD